LRILGLEYDPRSTTALADKAALIAAQGKIGEIRDLIEMKQFQMALRQVEAVTKDVGSNFRDLNILKVETLLELNRPEDAYNLSNLMVWAVVRFLLLSVRVFLGVELFG
jgi:hypothetical protein